MDNIQHIEKAITPEMAEVLEHMRYDKETDTILVDCDLCCKIKNAVQSKDERHDAQDLPR